MVNHTNETHAFNAVLNLAWPDADDLAALKHPIPGVDFLSRHRKSPLYENRSAKQIYDWFKDEFEFLLKHATENKEDDEIFFAFFEYFQIDPGNRLLYKDFIEFCKDVDWYKLERELRLPDEHPFAQWGGGAR